MEYLVAWLIGVALGWVVLLVVMLIAQRIADFGMPPFAEFAWRAAVVVGVTSAVGGALDLIHPWLSLGVCVLLWIGLMEKLFDLDFYQIVVIVLVSWLLQWALFALLLIAFA